MRSPALLKTGIDGAMAALLLALMARPVTGTSAHQWLGAGMFLLVTAHLFVNRAWIRNILKGRYTAVRFFTLIISLVTVLLMVALLVSGIVMSPIRYMFSFLSGASQIDTARTLHHYLPYWVFILTAVHIGTCWKKLKRMLHIHIPRKIRTVLLCLVAFLAMNGVYAFIQREIYAYIFLMNPYTFFDYEEYALLFFLDYISMLVLFAGIATLVSFPKDTKTVGKN